MGEGRPHPLPVRSMHNVAKGERVILSLSSAGVVDAVPLPLESASEGEGAGLRQAPACSSSSRSGDCNRTGQDCRVISMSGLKAQRPEGLALNCPPPRRLETLFWLSIERTVRISSLMEKL